MRRDAAHPLALGRPVAEHGAVEQLGERLAAEPGLLRERGGRVLAHDPGHVVIHHPGGVGPVGGLQGAHPLGRRSPAAERVLSGAETKTSASAVLDLVAEERRRLGEELQRHLLDPAERLRQEALRTRRAGARRRRVAPIAAAQLLEQRPGLRVAADEHLPARLDAAGSRRRSARRTCGRVASAIACTLTQPELLRVRVRVDLLHMLDLVDVAPRLRELDADPCLRQLSTLPGPRGRRRARCARRRSGRGGCGGTTRRSGR